MHADCPRCDALTDRVVELEHLLGVRHDAADIEKVRKALGLRDGAARLLLCLYAARGRLVTNYHLADALPPIDHGRDRQEDVLVKVLICSIRKAIGAASIQTVWGSGYRLTPEGLATVGHILGRQVAA